jgi:hypothetical protein
MNIYLILRFGGSLTNIVLFGVSLRAFWIKSPGFARVFSGLCFLEVIADIIQWISDRVYIQQITSNSLALTELIIYTFIFLQIIHSKIIKWILSLSMSILFIIYLFVFFKKGIDRPIALDMELLDFAIFLIPGFAYLKEIFTYQRKGDLTRDFTFWFVTASLFIFASTIISRLGLIYLYTLKVENYLNNFYLLSGLVFIIVNILYIKAYLCLKK